MPETGPKSREKIGDSCRRKASFVQFWIPKRPSFIVMGSYNEHVPKTTAFLYAHFICNLALLGSDATWITFPCDVVAGLLLVPIFDQQFAVL
jgi:hypothetical protein